MVLSGYPLAPCWLLGGFPLWAAPYFIAAARVKLGSAACERTRAPKNTHRIRKVMVPGSYCEDTVVEVPETLLAGGDASCALARVMYVGCAPQVVSRLGSPAGSP